MGSWVCSLLGTRPRSLLTHSRIDKFRFFARECVLCVEEATYDKHRELFLEMATAWTQIVADEMSTLGNREHTLCAPFNGNMSRSAFIARLDFLD
jgi:hypothetical protein